MSTDASPTLSPYAVPVEGQGDVKVYHVHTPFTPPSDEVTSQSATPVYTSGGGTIGGAGASEDTGKLPRFVSPDKDLGRNPGMTTCPNCQQQVMTNVTFKAGVYAWLMCLLFICCGLVLCCCLIPFFLKNFKDAYHTCPRCNRVLYVDKKRCCS